MPSFSFNLKTPVKNSELEAILVSVAGELGLKAKVKDNYTLFDDKALPLERTVSIRNGVLPVLKINRCPQDPYKNYTSTVLVKSYLFGERAQTYIEKVKSELNSLILAENIWANFCFGPDDDGDFL